MDHPWERYYVENSADQTDRENEGTTEIQTRVALKSCSWRCPLCVSLSPRRPLASKAHRNLKKKQTNLEPQAKELRGTRFPFFSLRLARSLSSLLEVEATLLLKTFFHCEFNKQATLKFTVLLVESKSSCINKLSNLTIQLAAG